MKEFVEKLIGRLEEIDRKTFRISPKDAIEIVNQLAEEYNNGWIPCSERLPVYLDNVLVCTENGGRTIAHIKNTPIEWVDMYMNKINNVVAWQPLPAPYQKGE